MKLDYPILSDPDGKAAKALGIFRASGFSSRVTFYIGKDGRILYIDKKVKPGTHGADVAKKLAELGIPKK